MSWFFFICGLIRDALKALVVTWNTRTNITWQNSYVFTEERGRHFLADVPTEKGRIREHWSCRDAWMIKSRRANIHRRETVLHWLKLGEHQNLYHGSKFRDFHRIHTRLKMSMARVNKLSYWTVKHSVWFT